MTIAIHQPNMLPRLSYFQKIAQSDVFVLLTHCQFSNTNFQNYFNIGETNYTMKVERSMLPIIDTRYKQPDQDWEVITNKFPQLKRFDNYISHNLAATNHAIIISACDKLNIRTRITRDRPTTLTGTARLIDICKQHGATKYLSGPSGKNYLDLSLFDKAGIEVIYQTNTDTRPLVDVI